MSDAPTVPMKGDGSSSPKSEDTQPGASLTVLVPREPTEAMLEAIAHADWHGKSDLSWADGWRIMVAASQVGIGAADEPKYSPMIAATQRPDPLDILIDDAFEKMGQQPADGRLTSETGPNRQDKAHSPDTAEDDTPECEACEGSGRIVEEARTTGVNQHSACQSDCDECDGTGRKQQPESVVSGAYNQIAATQQATGEGAEINWKSEWEAVCAERIKDRERSQQIINERDAWILELVREKEALSTQQAVSPPEGVWRPIETAPKSTSHDVQHGKFVTGVYLLGFIPDNAGLDRQSGIDTIWWEPNENDGAGAWFGPGSEPCNPTHWMPLPPAPDAIGEEK